MQYTKGCPKKFSSREVIDSNTVTDPEGGRGSTAPSKIGQNLAKLPPFLPILASTLPLTDHPGSAPEVDLF